MSIKDQLLHKAILLSTKIDDDVAVGIGGFAGGVVSFINGVKIIEYLDFTVHAVLGGMISFGIKNLFEWVLSKKKNNG